MKIFLRLFIVFSVILSLCGQSFAAGSWGKLDIRRYKAYNELSQGMGLVVQFTADASAATVPDYSVGNISCFINSIDVEFDAVTPATSGLTVTITTTHGIPIATGTATTSVPRIELDKPVQVVDGLIIKISGNSVNSGKAKVVVNIM